MSKPLLLIVEDDGAMRRFLSGSLQKQGYQTIGAASGEEAELLARTHNPDLVLLDLGLPGMDGAEFLQSFRSWSKAPVVVLSARHHEAEKVKVLDCGADDYLTKPFGAMELSARIRVALRHVLQKKADGPIIKSGTMQIDVESRAVTQNGREVKLTPLEFKLLAALAARGGKVATHRQLLGPWTERADPLPAHIHEEP